MQRDAAERVRQMQRRAQEKLSLSNNGTQRSPSPVLPDRGHSSPPLVRNKEPVPQTPPVRHASGQNAAHSQPSFGDSVQGILNQLHLDEDRLLLLILFLVLIREDADPILLLALAYIFL